MGDIFREVDEDLRRDRAERVWKRFAPFVYGIVAVVLLLTAGIVGWREWTGRQAIAASAGYERAVAALAADETERGMAEFSALAGEAPAGYELISRLQLAAAERAQGNTQAALDQYAAIADNADFPDRYRELADMLYGLTGVGTAPPDDIEQRLTPLTESSQWQFSAREVLALVALERGDDAAARDRLMALSADPAAPASIRQRAEQLASVLRGG